MFGFEGSLISQIGIRIAKADLQELHRWLKLDATGT
jgi:hypothetical protein